MDRSVGVVLTAFAGGLVALQAPINSKLGKTVGTLPAATVSFALGLVVLTTLTVLVGGGFGDVGKASSLPWYYLLGGVLGAVYVTTVLVAVRTLGAGGITAATVAGQLAASVVVDHFGLLGVHKQPVNLTRIVGVAFLVVGVVLVVRD
jgi:transporter family-2 protein